jgi:hypothetical protein
VDIFILNGNPDDTYSIFDNYLINLEKKLSARGHNCSVIELRKYSISPCCGCFSCFIKSPGICIFKDDGVGILQKHINSNLTVFASPLIMGLPSALLKRMQDRLFPVLHPKMQIFRNKVHLSPRYEKHPKLAVIVDINYRNHRPDDAEITFRSYSCVADDFSTDLIFTGTTNQSTEEVANAISSF